MRIQITGRHIDVGDAFRARVQDEIRAGVGKYFDRDGGGAEVAVSRDGHAFRVDCALTLASGQDLAAHGTGADVHQAFDAALARLVKRVRRYAARLKDRHPQALARQAAETAAYFVLQAPDETEGDDLEPDTGGIPEPLVIAETERPLETLTVSQAVDQLDVTNSQTIVFRNAAHGGLSVVYRRPDGNFGWIDPERTRAKTGPTNGHG
jgi:ribosomal subunit interface protein